MFMIAYERLLLDCDAGGRDATLLCKADGKWKRLGKFVDPILKVAGKKRNSSSKVNTYAISAGKTWGPRKIQMIWMKKWAFGWRKIPGDLRNR